MEDFESLSGNVINEMANRGIIICKLFNLFKIKYLWRILSAFKVNVLLYSFILNLNILLVFNIGVNKKNRSYRILW